MVLASQTHGVGREQTELSAQEGDGIIIGTSFVDSLPTAEAKAFIDKFHKYAGNDEYVGEYGEYGYRRVSVGAEAVKKAKREEPDDDIAPLDGVNFKGGGGLYTIDGKTNPMTMDIHIVKGNAT